MLVTPWGVWQSSDFRLTRSGRTFNEWSIKHVCVRCPDGTALITYTGAGWVKGADTSAWLAKQLTGEVRSLYETIEHTQAQASAQKVRDGFSLHAFMVGAFTRGKPIAYSIECQAPNHDFQIVEQPLGRPLVKGEDRALNNSDRKLLERASEHRPKHIPGDYLNLLANVNKRAASHTKYGSAISRASYTAYLAPEADNATGIVHRWGAKDPVDPPLAIPMVFLGIDYTSSFREVSRGARNKLVVRTVYEEIWNNGRLELADEFIHTNYVQHPDDDLSSLTGPEREKRNYANVHGAFPDWTIVIEDMISEGDKVATRFTARGTHRGEFMGIPPTGRIVILAGIVIDRVQRGKVVESWISSDNWGLVQQLAAAST
jgi:predicted ester cyclase